MDSDTRAFQVIVAEFKNCPTLHHVRLTVSAQDGGVTISGCVNTLAERKAAERAAHRVAGINRLVIEINAAAMPASVRMADITALQ